MLLSVPVGSIICLVCIASLFVAVGVDVGAVGATGADRDDDDVVAAADDDDSTLSSATTS